MENNIPTAEEFIEKNYYSLPSELEEISWLMQEFAKLHVEQALKKASQGLRQASGTFNSDYSSQKISILNSYPLTNIK